MAFLLLNDRKSIGKVNDISVIRVAVVEDDELEIRKVTEYLERSWDENGLALNIKLFRDGEDLAEDYRPD